jgi:protease-4
LHGFLSGYISDDTKNDDGESTEDQSSSEDIVFAIQQADADDTTKAIILEVDSTGGFGVAGEEVANALGRAKKPTVAWIRERGLSAAYWSATGAKTIFASTISDVGSIGVTLSYLDNYKKNQKDGLTFNSLSTGKFKDTGNPDKPLTPEEKDLIMRDLDIADEHFIKSVATNRNLDIGKVRQLADGSSMPGELALQNGLIDKIGGIYEIKNFLKEKIGEEVEICW